MAYGRGGQTWRVPDPDPPSFPSTPPAFLPPIPLGGLLVICCRRQTSFSRERPSGGKAKRKVGRHRGGFSIFRSSGEFSITLPFHGFPHLTFFVGIESEIEHGGSKRLKGMISWKDRPFRLSLARKLADKGILPPTAMNHKTHKRTRLSCKPQEGRATAIN